MARKIAVFALAAAVLLSIAGAVPTTNSYDALKREGERYYEEKSFSRAHAVYLEASKLELPEAERRWVTMRLAASALRGGVGTLDEARKPLEALIADANHDRVWAEANEALGDFHMDQARGGDFYNALRYFQPALDWWAGSSEVDLARERYLNMVWKLAAEQHRWYAIPREIIVNATEIAQTAADRAKARFILAWQLSSDGRPESVERAMEHLELVIAEGKKSEWYDDALFLAGQILSQERGHIVVAGTNEIEYFSDYARALEYFRRIVREFTSAESRHHDDAQQAIENITRPTVGVSASG
ncbi:MAG TPA: hypothetical protein VEU30_10820, partial [Thermoanaerobaculia bacterium]|nr:hypothetical protein [Thermoanaerobaculia bacterium]